MKKLILLLIFFLIIPSTLAICCNNKDGKEGGCYPGRGKCCEESDKIVGYVGCKAVLDANKPTDYTYYCPQNGLNDGSLGPCLQCSTSCKPDGTDCNWIEVDKCSGLSCVIEYLSGTKIPSIVSSCTDKCMEGEVWYEITEECVEVENIDDATCKNIDCASGKFCCNEDGSYDKNEIGLVEDAICSGDNDKDGICNYYDNCEEVPNSITLGTCLPLTIKKTCSKTNQDCGQGGICSYEQEDSNRDRIGNACQYEVSCESSYGDRQCCDELDPTATGKDGATFFGFIGHCTKESLGDIFRGVGCWSECVIKDESGTGKDITFDVGPCIDSQRTVRKLQDGEQLGTPIEEPCSGIPLIPFFTSFNLIFTFLILFLYYFREK